MQEQHLNNLPDLEHLIQEHEILKSFNINRRVTKPELVRIAKSMGMDSSNIEVDDLQSVISTLSNIEYSCGEVPGTKHSSTRSLKQFKDNYEKLNMLVKMSLCIEDLLHAENLSEDECLFVLNKCIVDFEARR